MKTITDYLNALEVEQPEIVCTVVFSSDGNFIAQDGHQNLPFDWQQVVPALASVVRAGTVAIGQLGTREWTPNNYQNFMRFDVKEGHFVLLPVNQQVWIGCLVRWQSQMGLVYLNMGRTGELISSLIASDSDIT